MTNGKCSSLFLFNNPYQVRHLCDRTAHRRRIRTLDYLIELRQPKAANYFLLLDRAGDRTTVILNPNFGLFAGGALYFRGHIFIRKIVAIKVLQPVCRANALLRKDLSSSANHQMSRRPRYADW